MGRYYSPKQQVHIWWRQDGHCGDCGTPIEVDQQYHHILNWKDGGATSIDNGVLLCKSCHDSAHNNARFRDSITLSHNNFRYANFSKSGESNYIKTISEIKDEISKLKNKDFGDNFFQEQKESKDNIRTIINKLKSLYLIRNDKNDLFDRVNFVRDSIHETIQNKIKDNYSKSYNLACESYNFVSSLKDFKKATDTLKEYQNKAKKYMLPKKEREEINNKFQESWNLLNEKRKKNQEIYEKETRINFNHYMSKVKSIENNLNKYSNFKDLREQLKTIQKDMKVKKFKKEDRQKLFSFSQKLFESIYSFQQQNQREYEYECKNNKAIILSELNDFIVTENSDFKEKRNFLKKIQSKMKGEKFKKEDRTYLFDRMNGYFQEIQKLQTLVYERKQREWKEKQAEKQAQWEQKQREYKNRLQDNIQRTLDSINRLEDSIYFDKNKLSEKKSKLYSVSDKWRSSLQDSIRNIEDKIYSKEDKVRSMYNKVSDMRSKL